MTLDDLRDLPPDLGFAVSAYEPGGAVTLEVFNGDDVFSFTGPTLQAAIDLAFPPPAPVVAHNVFD